MARWCWVEHICCRLFRLAAPYWFDDDFRFHSIMHRNDRRVFETCLERTDPSKMGGVGAGNLRNQERAGCRSRPAPLKAGYTSGLGAAMLLPVTFIIQQ